jgi:competence protein ComEC
MSPVFFHRPIVPLLVSIIIGILLGIRFPGKMFWASGLMIMAGAGTGWVIRKKGACLTTPLLLFIILGYLSIQPWVSPRFPPNHIIHHRDIRALQIEGRVETIDFVKENRTRLTLQTEHIRRDDAAVPAVGRIRVTVFGKHLRLSAGDRISFSSKIRSFRNFNNPGRFDYKRYMIFKKIWGTVYVSSAKVSVHEKGSTTGFSWWMNHLRFKITRFIGQQATGPAGGVLKALLVGDRTDIPADLKTVFYRTGVGHILAISGLHIGIIATVSFFVFRWLLSFVKPLLWNAWPRKGAALLTYIPVWAYGLLAGMSPSTLRAVIMVSIFLAALLLEKEQNPLNTLAVAAFLILTVNPPSLFSISFQLSFTAVFSILLGHHHTRHFYTRKQSGLRLRSQQRFFAFVLTSLFAIMGTLPLVMNYFHQVSLVGLLGNLIAIPVIGFVVVPLGLFSVFLYPLNLTMASAFLKTASFATMPAVGILSVLSEFPFAAVTTITPSMIEMICYFSMAFALCCLPGGSGFRKKLVIGTLCLGATVLIIDTGYWVHRRFLHKDLRVTAIDVGQGSAALMEFPGGKTVLIDGGGFSDNAIFNIGARVIAPLLLRNKIMTVDTLILSHPNSDHLNGLLYIAEHFNVKQIWTNGEPAASRGYADFMKIIEKRQIRAPEFRDLFLSHESDTVRIELLYPPSDFMNRKRVEKWRNSNNNSLVIKVRFGDVSFLFPGDIMKRAEKELVEKNGERLKSTVLFSPHHGSRHSSTRTFLDRVSPEVVVISSGWRNRAGAPHPTVLRKYRNRGCRIYNTAVNGAVAMETDGRNLRVKPFIK